MKIHDKRRDSFNAGTLCQWLGHSREKAKKDWRGGIVKRPFWISPTKPAAVCTSSSSGVDSHVRAQCTSVVMWYVFTKVVVSLWGHLISKQLYFTSIGEYEQTLFLSCWNLSGGVFKNISFRLQDERFFLRWNSPPKCHFGGLFIQWHLAEACDNRLRTQVYWCRLNVTLDVVSSDLRVLPHC